MAKFSVGLILGLAILPLLILAFIEGGHAPAAATAAPMPFERFLAGTALHARVNREAPTGDIKNFTAADLAVGGDVYKHNCAQCHGLPPLPSPAIAKEMFPEAPQLLSPEGWVTDDPVGVTYWKVKNGIRLSGMPSFANVLSDQQVWDVSALLARADKLPAEAKAALKPTAAPNLGSLYPASDAPGGNN